MGSSLGARYLVVDEDLAGSGKDRERSSSFLNARESVRRKCSHTTAKLKDKRRTDQRLSTQPPTRHPQRRRRAENSQEEKGIEHKEKR